MAVRSEESYLKIGEKRLRRLHESEIEDFVGDYRELREKSTNAWKQPRTPRTLAGIGFGAAIAMYFAGYEDQAPFVFAGGLLATIYGLFAQIDAHYRGLLQEISILRIDLAHARAHISKIEYRISHGENEPALNGDTSS